MSGAAGTSGGVTRAADPDQPYRVLSTDGSGAPTVEPADLGLKDEDLREMYRLLVKVRRADVEATALQRQGQLAVYPPLIGQEAAQVGSAFAVQRGDYLFPSYRELGAAVVRGVDLVEYLHFYRATWHGGTFDANEHRFGYVSVPVGSQTLHAVGWAMGAKKDGRSDVAVAYFGDGATSEGDVHEAWNFAAVFRAPVVFFCQNNQWAISVPLSRQTVAPIWRKAGAYGFPGGPRRRERRPRRVPGDEGGGRTGPDRGRADADRGPHVPAGAALHRGRRGAIPAEGPG